MYHASMVLLSNPFAPMTDTTLWIYAVVAHTAIYIVLFSVNTVLVLSE